MILQSASHLATGIEGLHMHITTSGFFMFAQRVEFRFSGLHDKHFCLVGPLVTFLKFWGEALRIEPEASCRLGKKVLCY